MVQVPRIVQSFVEPQSLYGTFCAGLKRLIIRMEDGLRGLIEKTYCAMIMDLQLCYEALISNCCRQSFAQPVIELLPDLFLFLGEAA